MKIVVDDKIPYIQPALHQLAEEVVAKAGCAITSDDVRDADILIVRTRTRCDRALLSGSRVRLVVTATIGYDHLDTDYLRTAGIAWTNCPGCNATSVAQYVMNSLLVLQQQQDLDLSRATLGIIGVGHVGTAVLEAARRWGINNILLNDPPREAAGDAAPEGFSWSSLERIQAEADILTLHTPLTTVTPYPTHHLVDDKFFNALRRKPVLINAARGGIVDESALLAAMDAGRIRTAIIDTWEGEPDVNRRLLEHAFIATPHIAGYSADGKANATRMALTAVCRFLGREMTFDIQPPKLERQFDSTDDDITRALKLYNPLEDSQRLKEHPEQFESLRGHYPLRREQWT
ncbi:MAG: 4-phosphoerythronate dehydrogenase [Bacteroidaceae bacterium]|nr:4-phosphoerythronate dehydrogenase [Bacteroidaceae bacterium]